MNLVESNFSSTMAKTFTKKKKKNVYPILRKLNCLITISEEKICNYELYEYPSVSDLCNDDSWL